MPYKNKELERRRRRRYNDLRKKRRECQGCGQPNDNLPHVKCKSCRRRAYVRDRVPVVVRAIKIYQAELRALLEEDRAFRRFNPRSKPVRIESAAANGGRSAYRKRRAYRWMGRKNFVGPGHPNYLASAGAANAVESKV